MTALPSRPYQQPVRPVRRRRVDAYRKPSRSSYQTIRNEAAAKLSVNCLIIFAALAALVRLIPFNVNQQARLQELQVEVSAVQGRVDHLQADLNYYFDPQQTQRVMQEQSQLVDPSQRRIVWLNPSNSLE